jgi:acetyl esterase/lipase
MHLTTRAPLVGMVVVLTIVLLGAATRGRAAEPEVVKKTFVYKAVAGVRIEADVYRPNDDRTRPVVVWLHGGALIVGSREQVPTDLRRLCQDEGYVLVSLDYRLAPEVKLPEIIADIKDAFAWLRQKGPALFAGDPGRIVVTGGSAGGYLTMMTGVCVKPSPTALVAYWGYGDMDGDWYTKPSEHYRQASPLLTAAEAERDVGRGVITGTRGELSTSRGRYYRYLRQNGLWTQVVSGLDPAHDPDKLTPYCPVRNITPKYPPILMVHGTQDHDVPFEKSQDMAKELTRNGVPHELVSVPGADHGLAGGDPKLVAAARARALEFIRQHLQ